MEYLSNIVRALNVENEPLEKWRVAVNSDMAELRKEAHEALTEGKETSVSVRMAEKLLSRYLDTPATLISFLIFLSLYKDTPT